MAGHQLGHDAVGDVVQFVTIGVADDQNQREHDPEQRCGQRLHETSAEHDEHAGADKDQERDLVNKPNKIAARQPAERSFAAADDEDDNGNQKAG